MSLQPEIDALCEAANRLLRLGLNGTPIYTDSFRELNADVYRQSETLLDRCWVVLGELSASLLKCQLLVACYGEVFDENLAEEAHAIIKSWNGRVLTEPEREVSEYLNSLEANSCLGWEIE